MRPLSTKFFRVEALVLALAAVSVVALAFVFVHDTITQTQSTLRSAGLQEVVNASNELKRQYDERAAFGEVSQETQSLAAQDLSLKGLSLVVLRSFRDVKGGFYAADSKTVAGVAASEGSLQNGLGNEERKVVEEAVRASTATAQSGFDTLVAAATSTADGRYAWAVRRLIGVQNAAPVRRRWWTPALVLAAIAGVAGVASISIRLRRGVNGIKQTLKRLETDFNYRPTEGSDDFAEIHAAIANMADRRLELEASLRLQDRLAALGKVVAGVAHEIRNPLNSIKLQLELLKRKTRKGVASVAEVEAAMEQVDRLNSILGQLLGLRSPEVRSQRWQPVLPLIKRSVEIVNDRAQAKRITIDVTPGVHSGAEANVDALQLEQVLTNLLLNAIEAAPDQGKVEVQIEHRQNELLEMRVKDNGPGIPLAARDHIFDAFFTTRAEGTGLGLSVSREIVNVHGGALHFTTSESGTTFVVQLPVEVKS